MATLWSMITWVLGLVFGVLWWLVVKLLWILLWFALPLLIVAFVALRVAEKVLGRAAVHGWLRQHSLKYGKGVWTRVHRGTFALGALPFRVLFWLVVYTLQHSLVSLLWTPRWKPWTRAWHKRWRPRKSA